MEGWANSKIVEDFERYAELLEEEFGGKVENWVILNEPWVVSNLGYLMGEHAPSVSDHERFLKASHNPNWRRGGRSKLSEK